MMSKSPFGKYSLEQVALAESHTYTILLGDDFFSYNGKYTFTREKADYYYNQVNDGLIEILETGTEAEKEEAIICLWHLKILPFRLH